MRGMMNVDGLTRNGVLFFFSFGFVVHVLYVYLMYVLKYLGR